jgi:hypothetical protein
MVLLLVEQVGVVVEQALLLSLYLVDQMMEMAEDLLVAVLVEQVLFLLQQVEMEQL